MNSKACVYFCPSEHICFLLVDVLLNGERKNFSNHPETKFLPTLHRAWFSSFVMTKSRMLPEIVVGSKIWLANPNSFSVDSSFLQCEASLLKGYQNLQEQNTYQVLRSIWLVSHRLLQ